MNLGSVDFKIFMFFFCYILRGGVFFDFEVVQGIVGDRVIQGFCRELVFWGEGYYIIGVEGIEKRVGKVMALEIFRDLGVNGVWRDFRGNRV